MYKNANNKFDVNKFLKENDTMPYFKEIKTTIESDYLKLLITQAYITGCIDTLDDVTKINKE